MNNIELRLLGFDMNAKQDEVDFWKNRVDFLEVQLSAWREAFGTGQLDHATEILRKSQSDLEQMTRLWRIRGLALKKPCPNCGHVPTK